VPLQESHAFRGVAGRQLAAERRSKKRYVLDLVLKYRILGASQVTTGNGKLIDISSGGIAFSADDAIRVGANVEVSINWPLMLDDCLLKLVVTGTVLRSSECATAIQFKRYEFRVHGRYSKLAPPSSNCSGRAQQDCPVMA
jgi:hypothetical protein